MGQAVRPIRGPTGAGSGACGEGCGSACATRQGAALALAAVLPPWPAQDWRHLSLAGTGPGTDTMTP